MTAYQLMKHSGKEDNNKMQIRVKLYIECNAMLHLVCALNLQVLNSQSMDLNINQPALHKPQPPWYKVIPNYLCVKTRI